MSTITKRVAASLDDCYVYYQFTAFPPPGFGQWSLSTNISTINAGNISSSAYQAGGGMRFQNVDIPQGAVINSAKLTLTAASDKAGSVTSTVIRGQDADNSAEFNVSDYFTRPRCSASVAWNEIPAWTANQEYDSPDIKSIIQEIVDREGWVSGNAIVLFWDDVNLQSDSGAYRSIYTYDGSTTKAALLTIDYYAPPSRLIVNIRRKARIITNIRRKARLIVNFRGGNNG